MYINIINKNWKVHHSICACHLEPLSKKKTQHMSLKRINHCLLLCNLEPCLLIRERGCKRRRIQERLVLSESVEGSPLEILLYFVIIELGCNSKERPKKGENLSSRWWRRHRCCCCARHGKPTGEARY
jgi:hypothetical protein